MSDDCVFCKIVAGEIPCHKLYENDHVLAFLDNGPLTTGHSLVIPKEHHRTLDDLPADQAAACMRIVPSLARAITATTGTHAWNLLQNNGAVAHQAVEHVHFHIIPKQEDGAGLGISWPAGDLDPDDAEDLAGRIHDHL